MIFISEKQKFRIGVSINHKMTQEHSMIRFTEREMTLEEIVLTVKENCFFYPLVEQSAFKDGWHPVVKATEFKSTCLIPFDFDYEKGKGIPFEQCLQMLGDDLCPTIAFRTRSYDADAHIYHYRLMYLFNTYVIGRQQYYTLITSVRNALKKRLGDIGDDGDAYGFNTKEKGWKGHCCKPIRTNSKGDVVVSRRMFNVYDFEVDETFIRHPELLLSKKNTQELAENYVDEVLTQFIVERNYQGIEKFPLIRNFSYTHSQFHNGFAIVRGNADYAEFPRKFTFSKKTHRYEVSHWVDGDKRRKKLRLVALISRFNDYIDNKAETISGNELFLSVYFEAKRHYNLYDSSDSILPVDLLRIVNEVMSLEINKVLDIVRQYTSSSDRGKRDHKGIIRKRNLIRIDKSFWRLCGEGEEVRFKKIKLELRFATRFVLLLQHYNENISRRENTEYLNTLKESNPTVPGCSLSQLSLFREHCSTYLEEAEKTVALEDLLFIESGLSIKNIPSKYSIIKTMLEDKPELKEKMDSIVNRVSIISKWNEDGSLRHSDIGRPSSEWQSVLTDDDAKLKLSCIAKLLETKGFTPPKNSIKTWKYRVLKRIKE